MFRQVQSYSDFEHLVFSILAQTGPEKIDHRDGGRDRGRDILLSYVFDGRTAEVVVECKYQEVDPGIRTVC